VIPRDAMHYPATVDAVLCLDPYVGGVGCLQGMCGFHVHTVPPPNCSVRCGPTRPVRCGPRRGGDARVMPVRWVRVRGNLRNGFVRAGEPSAAADLAAQGQVVA
jgi:hypothetical protein